MSNGSDTWGTVSKYVKDMTELAVDAGNEHVDRVMKIWKSVGDNDFDTDDALETSQEIAGAAIKYTAKVYVKTRDLMVDLAK